MGITWATAWLPVGAITGWVTGMLLGFPVAGIVINSSMMFGFLGFVSGTAFAALLGAVDGRRRFDQLSFPRLIAWGALGGLFAIGAGLVGLSFSGFGVVAIGVVTLLGAGSAAGTLAIARAAGTGGALEDGGGSSPPALDANEIRDVLGRGRGGVAHTAKE